MEIIKKRRSIRSFKDTTIPQAVIDKLVEAIIWAPSAGNLQSRKFFFVYDDKVKAELVRAAYDQKFLGQAPLVVVGCADLTRASSRYEQRGMTLYAPQDVAASVQNLMLVATEEGLGTVWVGAFDEAEASKVLKLPETLRPVVMVPVGYPAKTPNVVNRRPINELIEEVK